MWKPTHRFNGIDQLGEAEVHPLAGKECMVVEEPGGSSQSGYDCTVLMRKADFAEGYSEWYKTPEGIAWCPDSEYLQNPEYWMNLDNSGFSHMAFQDPEFVYQEVNFSEELEEIK